MAQVLLVTVADMCVFMRLNTRFNCVGVLQCVCVFAWVLYFQPSYVWCYAEQSRTTGLKLCCYSSNELPGASAFLMKSSL